MGGIEVKVPKKKQKKGPDYAPGHDKEPVRPGEISEVMLADTLNWYGYFWDEKKSIKALTDYLKGQGRKEDAKAVRGCDDRWIHPTYGNLARMMDNGTVLPQNHIDRFEKHIEHLKKLYSQSKEEEKKEEKTESTPKPTVQDRVQEQADSISADIDFVIDEFLKSGYKDQKFKCYEWLDRQGIKAVHAKKIADIYRPMLEEAQLALTDDEFAESYSKMKKTDLKRFIKMLQDIISDCDTWADNQKKTQTPKKKKPKSRSAAKQVEKLQYLKEDKELKLASVPPEKIIGAQQVWLYNTKQKKLTRLDAMNRDGLKVEGTTIKNFDPEVSTAKSVRKPQETTGRVLDGGKRVLKKLMDELSTKDQEAKGRVNKDTIILRVE